MSWVLSVILSWKLLQRNVDDEEAVERMNIYLYIGKSVCSERIFDF